MFDFLITPTTTKSGRLMVRALYDSYQGDKKIINSGPVRPGAALVLYGLGGPDRYPIGMQHVEQGGTLVAWDVGYWDRKGPEERRKLRVSLNGLHPPQYVMRGPSPPDRAAPTASDQGGNPRGPVVLVGNGPKSNVIGANGWASAKSREIRKTMPGTKIVYRPKPKRPLDEGVTCDRIEHNCHIDELISGASLVVCRHSNVAVDACRLGVPVVCDDGAASAIYPKRLKDRRQQPDTAMRQDFLSRLAWWQWSAEEARRGEVWPWLLGAIGSAN